LRRAYRRFLALWAEEISKGRPARATATGNLELTKASLGRPDRPAVIGRQLLDGFARLVERTNIAELHRVSILILLDPSEWKALRAADIGPVGVNSARAPLAEERAGPLGPRGLVSEKIGMSQPNVVGLRIEHSQPVDAARAATEPALQTGRVKYVKALRLAIYVGMQRGNGIRP
jgi:hypothetical protein